MHGENIEREKQLANEELASLLNELVIKPIDERLEEKLRTGLFSLSVEIDDKLKTLLSTTVAKTRDIDTKVVDLKDQLSDLTDQLSDEFLKKVGVLLQSLDAYGKRVQDHAISNDSKLKNLGEQLDGARERIGQMTEQAFALVATQLKQHVEDLQAQSGRSEQILAERDDLLHTALRKLSQLSAEGSEDIAAVAVQLRQGISGLVEQGEKAVANQSQVQAYLLQLQKQAATQQLEIKRLQRSADRACWSSVIVGAVILCALTYFLLKTF